MAKNAGRSSGTQILTATQTESDEFHHPGEGQGVFLALNNHAGGTWTLEAKFPDGTWADVGESDVEFADNSIVIFDAPPQLVYRLTGGDVGATAWLLSNIPSGVREDA